MDKLKKLCFFIILSLTPGVNNNANSQSFAWVRQFTGTGWEAGHSIAVDAAGDVYTTGRFEDTADFDPGPGTYSLISAGNFDIFVSKLDASGNFLWAKKFGGSGNDYSNSIAVDSSGNVYITGTFTGTSDFDPGTGVYNLSSSGDNDIFVSRLDASGNFIWTKQFGGTGNDVSKSIAIDSNGNVYTTGYFRDVADFDPGAANYDLTSAGVSDIFVSKLDSSGNFLWAKQMGGTDNDYGSSIGVDAVGNVFTTGYFNGTADFDPGAGTYNLSSSGMQDLFVSRLDASGNFVWAKQIGGTAYNEATSIAVTGNGSVYTTGYFTGTSDFDPGSGTYYLVAPGAFPNVFISRLDASGNFIWARQFGGTNNSYSNSIALDSNQNVYTTGYFFGITDFDPDTGTYYLTSVNNADVFLSKLDSSGNFRWAGAVGGTQDDKGLSMAADRKGNIYATGFFATTVDFDPGTGTANLSIAGAYDAYVLKLSSGPTGIENPFGDPGFTNVYPNPFSQSTIIKFRVEEKEKVSIKIFDINGRLVSLLAEEIFNPGLHELEWNAKDENSGIYFIRFQTGKYAEVKKLLVMK